jgi:GTP cyclohydrolase II
MMKAEAETRSSHIRLTSHPGRPSRWPLRWGAATPAERGPVIATVNAGADRNAIGAHGGSYSIYRALAISSGAMDPSARPDLHDTSPVCEIGPHAQWGDPNKIVSLDPWGHRLTLDFAEQIDAGIDIRPSIAITRARLTLGEIRDAIALGRLQVDGEIVHEAGDVSVTKIAVDPVWWLPGVAERFGVAESGLRRCLFEQTGGMYPELVTRPDMSVFLPPIGGMTLYIFGDPLSLGDTTKKLTCRVHDECNGSDVFGSDICTCRPYLTHGIEEATRAAQEGGVGLIVYNRKEGRALGEVTKFLVYTARKRQPGGDLAITRPTARRARRLCAASWGGIWGSFEQMMCELNNTAHPEEGLSEAEGPSRRTVCEGAVRPSRRRFAKLSGSSG